jgi:hypothetical protein
MKAHQQNITPLTQSAAKIKGRNRVKLISTWHMKWKDDDVGGGGSCGPRDIFIAPNT